MTFTTQQSKATVEQGRQLSMAELDTVTGGDDASKGNNQKANDRSAALADTFLRM